MQLEDLKRNQLATGIALAILETGAQVVPDKRIAVWCVHDLEWWLGYDEASVAEAYRREYNLNADECTEDSVVYVDHEQLKHADYTTDGVCRGTFYDELIREQHNSGKLPRVLAYFGD